MNKCLLLAALICLWFLQGCDSSPIYTPTPVEVPLKVKCSVKKPEKPTWNLPQVKPEAPLSEKVKAALADIELGKGYTEQLLAALSACNDE